MNKDERIKLHDVGLVRVSLRGVAAANVFGATSGAYDIVDTDKPYLLWEDGSPMLWEDKTNVLLEQQKQKTWRQEARR